MHVPRYVCVYVCIHSRVNLCVCCRVTWEIKCLSLAHISSFSVECVHPSVCMCVGSRIFWSLLIFCMAVFCNKWSPPCGLMTTHTSAQMITLNHILMYGDIPLRHHDITWQPYHWLTMMSSGANPIGLPETTAHWLWFPSKGHAQPELRF